jgi:O-glycosyl hydrolase
MDTKFAVLKQKRKFGWHVQPLFSLGLLPVLAGAFLFAETLGHPLQAQSCYAPPAGIVGWWAGEGDASDQVGANSGTLMGGATATAAGMVGQCFTFDGTNGYVSIPDSPSLHPTNFTVEAWVRFSSLNSAGSGGSPAGYQYIVFKQNSQANNFEGIDLGKTRVSGNDYFQFETTSASAQSIQVLSATTIATGVWYHVAAVRGSNFMQLYVNGQLEGQTNITFAQSYGTLPLYFGTTGQSYWDHKLAGNLDEVTLYNRPLASNEIAAIYAAGAAGKCKTTNAPSIMGQPQNQTVNTGSGATFTVTAAGTPPLQYQWFFNGITISNGTGATLALNNVQLSQTGNYQVTVTNSVAGATSAVAILSVTPAGTITIDGSVGYQIIDGFGVNANSLSWISNDLKPVLDAYIDQAGMTLFHAIIENSNWESTNDNSDPNVMNWAYYTNVYTQPDFLKLWGMMGYLNQRGITNGLIPKPGGPVALWMGGESLKSGFENEYAETMVSMFVYARSNQNLIFHEVRAVNEPDISLSGENMTQAQYLTVMHDVGLLLDANGMSDVRFSGPDLAETSTAWMGAMMNDPYLMSKVAHFGVHGYLNETSDAGGVLNYIKQSSYPNLRFWMTEFNVWCPTCNNGTGPDTSWTYARGIPIYLLTLLGEGASAGLVFEAFDSQYYGYNSSTGQSTALTWSFWGLMGVDNTNAVSRTYTPRKGFYTYAQISKFVRPGAQRISVGAAPSGVTMLAFYNTNNAQFTLTGVNTNSTASSLSFGLSSLPAIPAVDLYYTTSASNFIHGAHVGVTNNLFSVTLPADSVFTVTYSNAMPYFLAPSLVNGNINLLLAGTAGFTYQIQASPDLANWTPLTNIVNTNGTIQFIDTNTANFSGRFYRAALIN